MIDTEMVREYVLVTGAAGGIGEAMVRQFSQAGYAVIATDICAKPDGMPSTVYIEADLDRTVTDESYAHEVFERIEAHLKDNGLAALVNNAAIQVLGGTESLTRRDWQATLNINLLAPFLWTQALLPRLEQASGCIINISSIHASLTKKGFLAYATSKAALSAMTRAMAVDIGPRVRINAIEPAAILTNMLKAGFVSSPELLHQLEQCHPQQRIGTPEGVASLALALTKGELQFLHGECIGLHGGIRNRLHDPL